MVFKPDELSEAAAPVVLQDIESSTTTCTWRPFFRHDCTFNPAIFTDVMINLIKNPNINSSWLFRADILHDAEGSSQPIPTPVESGDHSPSTPSFVGFELRRHIIRRLIPRNTMRDKPLDQTCLIYQCPSSSDEVREQTLVIYLPHVASEADMPFYHPVVRGIAFLHEWTAVESRGSVSVSYLFFDESEPSIKNTRTALHLLEAIYKHGQGRVDGYKKRVQHDVLVPQARVQNTYTALKQKYARTLIVGWAESTDPGKHVFEDLCIAAFLIELWADMYGQGPFPGFVDIGCGNGLLVYILIQEGFKGWGFDARARKSWLAYNTRLESLDPIGVTSKKVQDHESGLGYSLDSLRQLVLLPPPAASDDGLTKISSEDFNPDLIHAGRFPKGTFIISNHADELTPWTPILATISDCPFIMIPCCSHDLTGQRFRAPPPKDKTKADSTYSSLVSWISQIARDCGWEPEVEMLRIPSTRNTAVVGRKRLGDTSVDIQAIVDRYGGTSGYLETVIRLAKGGSSTSGSVTKEH
ncbi:hypothetical protein B0H66DRAFT_87275 [Apodospora peruviana]|uniref:tRNA (uracil-O(2)-)-methyltransferase n=1 Tax=Apodospora peruviana TaxID=516989 RepID=A0AAE0IV23_9PEZI|nr:hypothetical protein B0H66DRAFT_87275 [Apodospora peruviana]